MCRMISAKVFLGALAFLLLYTSSLTGASRCTCPPHVFEEYATDRDNAGLVSDGLLTELLLLGSAESGNLIPYPPLEYESLGYQAFRSALKVMAVMREKALIWEHFSHLVVQDNQLMESILNGLASDICHWMSEVIPQGSGFNCTIDGLLYLNKRLELFEKVSEAEEAAEGYAPAMENGVSTTRCAWINHRLLDNCRSTCNPDAPHLDTEKMDYYGSTFGCSGDITLCSNVQ